MCAKCKLAILFIRVPNFVDNSLCNKQDDEQNANCYDKQAIFTRMLIREKYGRYDLWVRLCDRYSLCFYNCFGRLGERAIGRYTGYRCGRSSGVYIQRMST